MNYKTLQKRGAEARAQGRSIFDNPFYASDMVPAISGDDILEWQNKVEAWNLGWKIEDAVRNNVLTP